MKTTLPYAPLPPEFGLRRGFTLVEVLTVIAIIAVLMAAGAIGLDNINAGKGTSSAIASCESLFEEARTIAVSKRCKSRIMVDARTGEDTYLRRVVIVREEIVEGNVVPNSWVLTSRGYEMPKGTFFSQVYSYGKGGSGTVATENMTGLINKDSDPNDPENPPRSMTDYNGNYYIYEFNGEGIFDKAGSNFVIGAGIRPKGKEPKTTRSAGRDFAGFVIWRNGRTSTFRSPGQIEGLPDSDIPFNF
jgi:prepilin-type N-terminal cleavage/methylation domain-containing protein